MIIFLSFYWKCHDFYKTLLFSFFNIIFFTINVVLQSPDAHISSTSYNVMCKVYTEKHDTSEIEHGSSACMVDNPLAKARGLSLRTGGQTMLAVSLICMMANSEPYSDFLVTARKRHL